MQNYEFVLNLVKILSLLKEQLLILDQIMQLLQLIPYNDTVRTDKNKLSICTPFSGVALTFLKASEGLRLMVVVLFSKKKAGWSYAEWSAAQVLHQKLLMLMLMVSFLWWEERDIDLGCFFLHSQGLLWLIFIVLLIQSVNW